MLAIYFNFGKRKRSFIMLINYINQTKAREGRRNNAIGHLRLIHFYDGKTPLLQMNIWRYEIESSDTH